MYTKVQLTICISVLVYTYLRYWTYHAQVLLLLPFDPSVCLFQRDAVFVIAAQLHYIICSVSHSTTASSRGL